MTKKLEDVIEEFDLVEKVLDRYVDLVDKYCELSDKYCKALEESSGVDEVYIKSPDIEWSDTAAGQVIEGD